MTTGNRWRIMSVQGDSHVGSVVYGTDEVKEQIELEIELHRMAGWRVLPDDDGLGLTAMKGRVHRVLRAVEFSPANDTATFLWE